MPCRCGWARRRGSPRSSSGRSADLVSRLVGASSRYGVRPRTRRRRCRRACRPAACRLSRCARLPHPRCQTAVGELPIGEADPLGAAQQRGSLRDRRAASSAHSSTSSRDLLEEPRVDAGVLVELLGAHAERVASRRTACGRRGAIASCGATARPRARVRVNRAGTCRSRRAGSRGHADAFCSASLKVRPMAITSPTRLHLRGEGAVGAGELLEGPARDLDDARSRSWLEARRGLRVMSLGSSSSGSPTASLAAILAMGKPGGLAGQAPSSARPAGSSR